MRISHTQAKSTAKYGYTTFKGIYGSITGGSRNGGGHVYPTMDVKMLNSSYVTVLLWRCAMFCWMSLDFGRAG
jgi:hypothetical protein